MIGSRRTFKPIYRQIFRPISQQRFELVPCLLLFPTHERLHTRFSFATDVVRQRLRAIVRNLSAFNGARSFISDLANEKHNPTLSNRFR